VDLRTNLMHYGTDVPTSANTKNRQKSIESRFSTKSSSKKFVTANDVRIRDFKKREEKTKRTYCQFCRDASPEAQRTCKNKPNHNMVNQFVPKKGHFGLNHSNEFKQKEHSNERVRKTQDFDEKHVRQSSSIHVEKRVHRVN